jgi:hypothetical protein
MRLLIVINVCFGTTSRFYLPHAPGEMVVAEALDFSRSFDLGIRSAYTREQGRY